MQMNLPDFIKSDPIRNTQRIWSEFLPNDPYCQQSVKEGRNYAVTKGARCDECKIINAGNIYVCNNVACNVYRKYGCKPMVKYYGSMLGRLQRLIQQVGDIYLLCCPESEIDHHYIGVDTITDQVLGATMLESIIPGHTRELERIYKCQDRVTFIQKIESEVTTFNPNELYEQIKRIVIALAKHRFNLGNINVHSMIITNQGIKLELPSNCSYDIDNKYRVGPIIDDYSVPTLDVFYLTRNNVKKYYFRIADIHEETNDHYIHTISKYGIPIVGRALDTYRLVLCLIIKCVQYNVDVTSSTWFQSMFLPSEHTRVITRIRKFTATNSDRDLIHCLYDREGPFSLRCDV